MTVFRLGISAPDHMAPARTHLGRVLVTIDDLRILMELVTESDEDKKPAIVEFAGGKFDDPGDLRQLSDVEIGTLSIKSSKIEVQLGPNSAMAIGDEEIGASLKKNWADQRITRMRPPPTMAKADVALGLASKYIWRGAAILAAVLIALVLFEGMEGIFAQDPLSKIPSLLAMVAISIGVGVILFAWSYYLYRPKNYAIVRAMTLDEYRRGQIDSSRHWQNATIALGGLFIATIGVLITILMSD